MKTLMQIQVDDKGAIGFVNHVSDMMQALGLLEAFKNVIFRESEKAAQAVSQTPPILLANGPLPNVPTGKRF